jgi:hypothetical protein
MGRLYVYEDLQSEEEVIVEFTCLSTFPGFLFMWRLPHDLRHPAFCNLIVYFSRMFTSMHTGAIKQRCPLFLLDMAAFHSRPFGHGYHT